MMKAIETAVLSITAITVIRIVHLDDPSLLAHIVNPQYITESIIVLGSVVGAVTSRLVDLLEIKEPA